MTSLVGEHIRYLPKPVGPWVDPTLAPRRWSINRKVNGWVWDDSSLVGP